MRFVICHPQRCIRKLARGCAKRMFASGPLIGYFIVCPGCGFPGSYLHTEAEYVETGPWITAQGLGASDVVIQNYRTPTSVSASKPLYCFGCHGTMVLSDNEITLAGSSAAA